MDNEPIIEMVGGIDSITMYETPDGIWVIRDHAEEVTTQGDTKIEALLMLADALAAANDSSVDLSVAASEIFEHDEDINDIL